MSGEASRFEFRVFARPGELEAQRARLRDEFTEAGSDAQEAVYLVGPRSDRNVKLRDDAIEIKALREIRDGLERWEPTERRSLPVSGAWLGESLCAELGVSRSEAPLPSYGRRALIGWVSVRPELRAVRVDKRRQRFRRGELLAEFARVEGPESLETLAVECEDAEVVSAWVSRLGLEGRPNTSYARWLCGGAASRG